MGISDAVLYLVGADGFGVVAAAGWGGGGTSNGSLLSDIIHEAEK